MANNETHQLPNRDAIEEILLVLREERLENEKLRIQLNYTSIECERLRQALGEDSVFDYSSEIHHDLHSNKTIECSMLNNRKCHLVRAVEELLAKKERLRLEVMALREQRDELKGHSYAQSRPLSVMDIYQELALKEADND